MTRVLSNLDLIFLGVVVFIAVLAALVVFVRMLAEVILAATKKDK